MTPTRRHKNVDPATAAARSRLGNAIKSGADETEIARIRAEMDTARIIASARRLADELPELPAADRARVIALIGGAA